MKKSFSTSWISSKKPRKQRKFRYKAPLHIKQKFLGCHLSAELRKKYGKRNIPVRKGDKIVVMRGTHKGKTGKVGRVSVKHCKVYVDGIDRMKKEGSRSMIPLQPSNIMITELNLDDKKRMKQEVKNG